MQTNSKERIIITIKLDTPLNKESICCQEKILQIFWKDTHVFLAMKNSY